jgi:hypothetical protein
MMACTAGYAAGVIGNGYLRERFRLRTIGLVAAGADDSGVGLRWLHRWVIGVFGLRSMADFAVQSRMFSQLFLVNNFGVAIFARLVTRMHQRARCQFSDSASTIVTVLPKRFRDDCSAHDQKRDQRDKHDSSEPDEVFYVSEQDLTNRARLLAPPCAAKAQ